MDVFDCHRVTEPEIQLIQSSYRVAYGKQLVRHECQYIEQHCIVGILGSTQHSLHTENEETAGGDVSVSVEELSIRISAPGMEPQQNLLQKLFCIELILTTTIVPTLILDPVREDGIVIGFQTAEVGAVGNAKLSIELGQYDFDGVDVCIQEVLIGMEEVF